MLSLFDIQINGYAGVDFQQDGLMPAELRAAVDALAADGTLRFFATLITAPLPALEARLANFERLRDTDPVCAAAVCGYHLEGPWLSPEPGFRGAHDPVCMGPPSWPDFRKLQRAARGRIRLVTLAPEWPGSADFIRRATGEGVHISLGHTDASEAALDDAIQAGARFCTHLGNGVPAVLPRHDNIIQRLLARDEITAFLIPDGIHLPPGVLRNFFRAKPPGHALLTTDAMAAAGAPPGRCRLGSHLLEAGADRIVRLPGSSQFAGSALTPAEGVRQAAAWLRLPAAEARTLFSTAVADHFGITLPGIVPVDAASPPFP